MVSLCVCLCPNLFLYKDTSHIGLIHTQIISFYLNYLFKGSVFKHNHILRSWGWDFNIKFEREARFTVQYKHRVGVGHPCSIWKAEEEQKPLSWSLAGGRQRVFSGSATPRHPLKSAAFAAADSLGYSIVSCNSSTSCLSEPLFSHTFQQLCKHLISWIKLIPTLVFVFSLSPEGCSSYYLKWCGMDGE